LLAEKLVSLINEKIDENDAQLHIVEFYTKIQTILFDYYIKNFFNNTDHQLFFISIEKLRNYLQTKIASFDSYWILFLEFYFKILSSLYQNISNCQTLISSNLFTVNFHYIFLI
jgi:hypothetical protein